MKIQTSTMP